MRLLECGAVGKKWTFKKPHGCVDVFNSPIADVEFLIDTKQRYNRVHSEAWSLGITSEDEMVNQSADIKVLMKLISQHKNHLCETKVIAECMRRRREKLLEADAVTMDNKEGLGAKVEKLVFSTTYGQDDPMRNKTERLSKEEAETLLRDNFTYVSVESMLPNGAVLQGCQLLFGQGSGTSGNGKHCSLEMIQKRATEAQEKYEHMTSGEEKTDGNDDGECVVFFWSFVHAPSVT